MTKEVRLCVTATQRGVLRSLLYPGCGVRVSGSMRQTLRSLGVRLSQFTDWRGDARYFLRGDRDRARARELTRVTLV
jgi:hypothetical protein